MKIHGYPFDYFRFSRGAMESLFEPALGIHVNASWYHHEAMYVGDPGAPVDQAGFQPHPQTKEEAWIIVALYATKVAPTRVFTDDYPYLLDA